MNTKNSFKPHFRSLSGQFECSKMILYSFNFDLIVFQVTSGALEGEQISPKVGILNFMGGHWGHFWVSRSSSGIYP